MRDWKLVKYRPKKSAPNTPAEWRLYNLKADVGEKENVATENPSIVSEILDLIENDELL